MTRQNTALQAELDAATRKAIVLHRRADSAEERLEAVERRPTTGPTTPGRGGSQRPASPRRGGSQPPRAGSQPPRGGSQPPRSAADLEADLDLARLELAKLKADGHQP